jgi:hypothetical protein
MAFDLEAGLPPRRRKDRTLQVCVDEEEALCWCRIARQRDVSISQLIREQMRKLREAADDGADVPLPPAAWTGDKGNRR